MSTSSTEHRRLDTNEEITAYVKNRLDHYRALGVRDDSLWERWLEDFEDWDINQFGKIDSDIRREFRDFLISRGIYMTPNPKGKHIDQQLATEVQREEFHEWTSDELVYYRKKNPLGVSTRNQDLKGNNKEGISYGVEVEKGKSREEPIIPLPPNTTDQQSHPRVNQAQWEDRPIPKNRQLESLVRMYKEEDKYRDGTDSFDYKKKIFLNNCNNACVEKRYFKDALTNMFAGDASERYLDLTISNDNLTFDERCDLIKAHYETVHWINRRETIWNTLNLIEEIRKCPDRLQAFNNL
ncbi:hypothetical protein K3495_g15670, partial [Podosphaera aphanis]